MGFEIDPIDDNEEYVSVWDKFVVVRTEYSDAFIEPVWRDS